MYLFPLSQFFVGRFFFSMGRTDFIQSALSSPDPGGSPRYSQKIISFLEKILERLEVRKFTFDMFFEGLKVPALQGLY